MQVGGAIQVLADLEGVDDDSTVLLALLVKYRHEFRDVLDPFGCYRKGFDLFVYYYSNVPLG